MFFNSFSIITEIILKFLIKIYYISLNNYETYKVEVEHELVTKLCSAPPKNITRVFEFN